MGLEIDDHERRERRHRSAIGMLVGALLVVAFGANLLLLFSLGASEIGLFLYLNAMAALACGVIGWHLGRELRARVWLVLAAVPIGPQSPLFVAAWWSYPQAPGELLWLAGPAAVQILVIAGCASISAWMSRRSQTRYLRCAVCGYSLVGLPRGAVCSECGDGAADGASEEG